MPSLSARPPPSLFLNNGFPRLFLRRTIVDELFCGEILLEDPSFDSLSEHSSFFSCDFDASLEFSVSDKLLSEPLFVNVA